MRKYIALFIILSAVVVQSAENPAPQKCIGHIDGISDKIVRIILDTPSSFISGSRVEVYTFFKKKIFGMNTTGWLLAATARVTGIRGRVITLRVLEEKSRMVVNGRRVHHLKRGKRIKLVLTKH